MQNPVVQENGHSETLRSKVLKLFIAARNSEPPKPKLHPKSNTRAIARHKGQRSRRGGSSSRQGLSNDPTVMQEHVLIVLFLFVFVVGGGGGGSSANRKVQGWQESKTLGGHRLDGKCMWAFAFEALGLRGLRVCGFLMLS